jgi:hypothetical protein
LFLDILFLEQTIEAGDDMTVDLCEKKISKEHPLQEKAPHLHDLPITGNEHEAEDRMAAEAGFQCQGPRAVLDPN